MADEKDIIDYTRVRKIEGSFSWIDHRFITAGFLEALSGPEITLYFFLVAVSDRNGVSFYHDDRICRLLKTDLSELGKAREGLVQRSLIAYYYPVYQVLALPVKPVPPPTAQELAEQRNKRDLSYIRKIKQAIGYGQGSQVRGRSHYDRARY
jgi:hypothetical protein